MLQFNRHVVFAVALPVMPGVVVCTAGRTHEDWQTDTSELQVIMQLVTIELCARRIDPAADTSGPIAVSASTATRIAEIRMTVLPNIATG